MNSRQGRVRSVFNRIEVGTGFLLAVQRHGTADIPEGEEYCRIEMAHVLAAIADRVGIPVREWTAEERSTVIMLLRQFERKVLAYYGGSQ